MVRMGKEEGEVGGIPIATKYTHKNNKKNQDE